MQVLEKTQSNYVFTGEAIGRRLAEALSFLRQLGCPAGEMIEVRRGRAILRGRLADLAALAG